MGKREPNIYGSLSFTEFLEEVKQKYKNIEIDYFQSNIEGELIDKLHDVGFSYDGVILGSKL